MLQVAVVASSPLVRAGLRAALEQAGDLRVVADCAFVAELLRAPRPVLDAAVIDLDDDADAALGELAELGDAAPPLVLLARDDAAALVDALADGRSVVPHDAPPALVAAAVRAAAEGLVATSRRWARRAWHATAAAPAHELERLTPREAEVLAKMADGLGNKAIAEALHISAHTAKFHVAQVIAKLAATSRAHAVAKALRAGLVEG